MTIVEPPAGPEGALVMLGVHVSNERRARGWTRRALADRAGVPQEQIAHVEEGRTPAAGFTEVVRLADAFGVPITRLAPWLTVPVERQ